MYELAQYSSRPLHVYVSSATVFVGYLGLTPLNCIERSLSYWIVLFVNFMPSVTEIQLNKLRAHFRARIVFRSMYGGGGDYNIGANQAGKRARSLLNCNGGIKNNEYNNPIGKRFDYSYMNCNAGTELVQDPQCILP